VKKIRVWAFMESVGVLENSTYSRTVEEALVSANCNFGFVAYYTM